MKKKYIVSLTALMALLLFSILSIVQSASRENMIMVTEPVVFVHGYKGTENSFGNMLERFEYTYQWGKQGLVYYVSSEGKINDYLLLNEEEDQPVYVQVIFENNRASFADTAQWLAAVLRHLKETYMAETVDLVGHSMGGIISTKYSMDYTSIDYPAVRRLIAIGSPFDGVYDEGYFEVNQDPAATDLMPDSPALMELREGNFPNHIEVLSIASTGDTVAEVGSVQSLKEVVPTGQLEEVIMEDDELGHSALHENSTVDHLIYSFLRQEEENGK